MPTALSWFRFKMRQLLEPEVVYGTKVVLTETKKILKSPDAGDWGEIAPSVESLQDDLSSGPGLHVKKTDSVECL